MKTARKLTALILMLGLLAGLAACGGVGGDPNLGVYTGTKVVMFEEEYPMTDIYDQGDNLVELKSDGKGIITLDGDQIEMTWTLAEDGKFNIHIDDGSGEDAVDCPGTLTDGVIVIDFMEMGLDMYFEKNTK